MIAALRGALGVAAIAGAAMTASGAHSETVSSILDFEQLDGWAQDDHAQALKVFLGTCKDLRDPDWSALCRAAQSQPPEGARAFLSCSSARC